MSLKELKKKYKSDTRSVKKKCRADLALLREEYLVARADEIEGRGRRRPIDPPKRSLLEEIGNSITHGAGAVFAVVAFCLMLSSADSPKEYAGAALYFFGLFLMFTMSCLYHAFRHGSTVKRIFRRFDYSCIYLLIGATFAPILLCYVGGAFGIAFLIVQWAIIITGITFIGVFGPGRLKLLHFPLYILLGWCGLVFLPGMIRNGDYAFLSYILGGGIVYSIGIMPFTMKSSVSHFIWHFFVLAGAVVQWIGVYNCIYLR